jgi:hypothetical protein
MPKVIDMRNPEPGHSMYRRSSTNPLDMQGRHAPLPERFDYVVGKKNQIFRIVQAIPVPDLGRDGYYATIEPTPIMLQPGEPLPTHGEISALLVSVPTWKARVQ